MELFPLLLAGHLIGDYLLQTKWMADQKGSSIAALVVHSVIYTVVCFLCTLPTGGISIICIAIIFLSHIILDRRTFVNWWCKNITKSADVPWLVIVADQSFHVVVLVVVTMLMK